MGCGYLIHGHLSAKINESGKRSIAFSGKDILQDRPISIRCGQCLGCKIENAKQFAIRCMHEAHYYDDNVFITLTFNDENLAKDKSLHKKDFQKFLKRLRKKFPQTIRYFHCGEYGTLCGNCKRSPNSTNIHKRCNCGDNYIRTCGRPHHHAVLFNVKFDDMEYLQTTKKGHTICTSETLARLWSKPIKQKDVGRYREGTVFEQKGKHYAKLGNVSIGEVTFDSASYVAQYVTKKTKSETESYYQGKQPEYVTMSRRPGLGRRFYEEYKETDIFPQDYVYMNGKKLNVPKYYSNQYALQEPDKYVQIKADRLKRMRETKDVNDSRQNHYKHRITKYKYEKHTERRLDNEN